MSTAANLMWVMCTAGDDTLLMAMTKHTMHCTEQHTSQRCTREAVVCAVDCSMLMNAFYVGLLTVALVPGTLRPAPSSLMMMPDLRRALPPPPAARGLSEAPAARYHSVIAFAITCLNTQSFLSKLHDCLTSHGHGSATSVLLCLSLLNACFV